MSRVLVVEDDPDLQSLVVARLKSAGHRVRGVGDGPAALALVRDNAGVDLFVLDIGLPGMDGFELLEQLRATPEHASTPAIFLSARVLQADIARGRSLGAEYLTKPFVTNALLAKVRGCLSAADEDW